MTQIEPYGKPGEYKNGVNADNTTETQVRASRKPRRKRRTV